MKLQRTAIKFFASIGFLTGIAGALYLFASFAPQKLHSYFDGVVQAQVATLFVPDFIAPEITLEVRHGQQEWVVSAEQIPAAAPVTLTGAAAHTFTLEPSPTAILTFAFSHVPARYQSEACAEVYVGATKVLHFSCHQIEDSDTHTLVLPLGLLEYSADELRVVTNLAETESLTVALENAVVLSDVGSLQLSVVDDHPVTVTANNADFEWQDGQYVFTDFEFSEQVLTPLTITVRDEYHNTTEGSVVIWKEPNPGSVQSTRYPDVSGMSHYLMDREAPWYSALFIEVKDTLPIQTALGVYTDMCAWQRDTESFRTQDSAPSVLDGLLRPVSVIETE